MTYFLKYVMTIDNCAASVYKIQIAQITCFLWHCCKTSIETPLSKNVHAWRFVNSFSILVACFDDISGMNVRYVKLFVYARNIKINIANQSFCWKSMKYWGDWRKICTSVFYCKIYGYLQTQNDFVLQNFWYLASLIQFTKCHQNSKVRGNIFLFPWSKNIWNKTLYANWCRSNWNQRAFSHVSEKTYQNATISQLNKLNH